MLRASLRRISWNASLKTVVSNPSLAIPRAESYSSSKARSVRPSKEKEVPEPSESDGGGGGGALSPGAPGKETESDAFYVVRKGDMLGIFKSLSECQRQVSSSVRDPPVGVYKGYSLCKETEQYLASVGFKNAMYAINVVDVQVDFFAKEQEDLFGTLVPCSYEQPDSSVGKALKKTSPQKTLGEPLSSCVLEFKASVEGGFGKAGAGAVIRTEDGRLVCRLREGLGSRSRNVAQYQALLLCLKYVLENGYQRISVQSDSHFVCSQLQGLFGAKRAHIANLLNEARELQNKFLSFEINYVTRKSISEAVKEARLAMELPEGEFQVHDESMNSNL
ncbi:hypothetical protein QJS04_geneDACA002238 [Acorus gramineus]|uniref:RNase H type-1 domain-containing protein n=1 Tax=Acorus gramineus TaxID=55184 RepID=A0AAV9A8J6_ACOGR|nr:hypothetical protein QJS04_geneDACA002238 [Acorus gramineus]